MAQEIVHLIDFIKKKSEQKNKKKLPPLSVKAVAISAYLRQKNLFPKVDLNHEIDLDQDAFKSSQSEPD